MRRFVTLVCGAVAAGFFGLALATAAAALDSLPASLFGRALMLTLAVTFLGSAWVMAMEGGRRGS